MPTRLTNVIFTGYKANFADYIASSDLFLLPSISGEDMPLAVLEAMNLGKPIIAGAVAGIVEEIEHLNSGILLKEQEMVDLHLEILKLFSDPKLRNQYGQNAKRRFEQNFSQPVVYGKLKHFIDDQKKIKEIFEEQLKMLKRFKSVEEMQSSNIHPYLKLDPIAYAQSVDREKIIFVEALFDKALPKRSRKLLWEALGRPKRYIIPSGHVTWLPFGFFVGRFILTKH